MSSMISAAAMAASSSPRRKSTAPAAWASTSTRNASPKPVKTQKKAGVEHLVRFEEKDLFLADFREATVVTIFLLPQINLRLRPKLLKDLKPGSRVVSNTFDMGDWKAEKQASLAESEDEYTGLSQNFFLWVIPQPAK